MAKFKKSAKSSPPKSGGRSKSAKPDLQAQAEGLSKSLSESAQQIWLAGVGAFGRAQTEGTRLFEGLVKEGLNLEKTARKLAGGRADQVRDAVENRVELARERATDTWDRLEKVFEERVQRALLKLGVPGRDDLHDLSNRVDTLTRELRRTSTAAPTRARKAARKQVADKTAAAKPATKAATAKKAAPRKSASKTATKRAPAKKASKSGT